MEKTSYTIQDFIDKKLYRLFGPRIRARQHAMDLQRRSLAAMGYDPHNMLLYSANKAYRARRWP